MTELLDHERAKYDACWQIPGYTKYSPGQVYARMFGAIAQPKKGQLAIDLGCGMGAGGKALAELHGLEATYLDMKNFARLAPFIEQPLWKPIPGRYDYGYCCDVMEHLPPEFTMLAIRNMLDCCAHVFLSISFMRDHFGRFVGEPLHLTVHPFEWWRDRLGELGRVHEARDFLGEGIFYVGRN